VEGTPRRHARAPLAAFAAYLLLFVLGVGEGVIGCFQFSRGLLEIPHLGPVPVAALGFCVLILVTCVLGSIGMGTPLGGLAIAMGWFAASFVLTLPTPGGSVIVTNTAAGKWYLYGGAVSAGLGLVLAFTGRVRRASRRSTL
jgi:hypothetical protein